MAIDFPNTVNNHAFVGKTGCDCNKNDKKYLIEVTAIVAATITVAAASFAIYNTTQIIRILNRPQYVRTYIDILSDALPYIFYGYMFYMNTKSNS